MTSNILTYLEKTVTWLPNKRAFWTSSEAMTFSELYNTTRAVGSALFRRSVRRTPVAVLMRRSPEAIAAMLGIAYAGGIFVPLDPNSGSDVLNRILEKVQPSVILCDDTTISAPEPALLRTRRVPVRSLAASPIQENVLAAVRRGQVDTDPLCVLYSEQGDRGVIICHRSAADAVENLTDCLSLSSNTVFGTAGNTADIAFLREMLCVLKLGAGAYLLPERGFQFPGKLMEQLTNNAVNTILWPTQTLSAMTRLNTFAKTISRQLTTVVTVGLPMSAKQQYSWFDALPKAAFYALFGPAESAGACACRRLRPDADTSERLRLGTPFPNAGFVLLDACGREVLPGMSGTLYLRGSCLAPGYYRDPAQTAAAFTQNPICDMPERLFDTGLQVRRTMRGTLELLENSFRIDVSRLQNAVRVG